MVEDESRFVDRSGESETFARVTPPYVLGAFCDYLDRLEASLVDRQELEEI